MIPALIIVMLLGACVYYVIRLDKKMKSQFGEEHLSSNAISRKAEQLASEATVVEDAAHKGVVAAHSLAVSATAQAIPHAVVPTPTPLQLCDSLFSPQEAKFWFALQEGLNGRWVMYPKVALRQLVIAEAALTPAQDRRMASLVIDVLLCHPATLKPVCALVLMADDPSLSREAQQVWDDVVQECDALGLPLLKFVYLPEYSALAIAARIMKLLGVSAPANQSEQVEAVVVEAVVVEPAVVEAVVVEPRASVATADSPLPSTATAIDAPPPSVMATDDARAPLPSPNPHCPLCQGAMQQRKVKTGPHAGREVWACVQYPSCKGVVVSRG